MRQTLLFLASLVVILGGCGRQVEHEEKDVSPNDWLLTQIDDEARFKQLQTQFRGFDQPMWEVGERYERLHSALERRNYQLAAYHWEKIRTAIENGIVKRPARAANARSLFLDPVWEDVRVEFNSADPHRAWAAFERAKNACQACHVAENVAYMNDQPLFELSSSNPGTSR